MRVAIFSDIHGNKETLTAILSDIKKENIDEVICLGDTIGLGPNSSECLDLIINNNIKMVLGNHELYLLKGTDIDDEMDEERIKHHNWIEEQITNTQRKYLEKCDITITKKYGDKKVLFEHFPIDYDSKDQYPFYDLKIVDDGSIKDIIKTIDYDLIFIGHEHKDFCVDNKLYDVGSSGCRIDDNTRYTIFDTERFSVETKIIKYDRISFLNNLLKHEYPNKDLIAPKFFGFEQHKYVRVMDGLKSNAGGFEYKIDEVNVATNWNPKAETPEEFGGFNFGTEDKILRWLHRGDTIYDVKLPPDAKVVLCNEEKGVYRSNKIIVTNPRKITDDIVLDLYKKTTLPNKVLAQCLVTLLWRDRKEISKYIIKDRVNKDNVDEFIKEFTDYSGKNTLDSGCTKEIYDLLLKIKES